MSSETPLTDAQSMPIGWSASGTYVYADFARQLELDLTRAHEDNRALRSALADYATIYERCAAHAGCPAGEKEIWAGIAKQLQALIAETASPEPAKNTAGEK